MRACLALLSPHGTMGWWTLSFWTPSSLLNRPVNSLQNRGWSYCACCSQLYNSTWGSALQNTLMSAHLREDALGQANESREKRSSMLRMDQPFGLLMRPQMFGVRMKSWEEAIETKTLCRQSLHNFTTSEGEGDRVQGQPGLQVGCCLTK